jgi:adenylate cyclase
MGSLSFKFGAAFVLVVLVAVAGMGAHAYAWARQSEVEHELADLRILAREMASRIDLSLAAGKGLADHLASTRDVQEGFGPGARGVHPWLVHQVGRTRGLSAIFLMSLEGKCLEASNETFIGHDFGFRTYFQEAKAGRLATSDWVIGAVTGTPRVFSAAPVRVQGRVAGVLVTEFLVEETEATVRDATGRGRVAVVLNAQGIAVAHSDPAMQYKAIAPLDPAVQAELRRSHQFMDRPIDAAPFSRDLVDAFQRVRATATPQVQHYRLGGVGKWAALAPLAEQPWVVAVAVPDETILLPMNRALGRLLLFALATTFGVFLMAFAMGWSLLRPIHLLSDAMARFGAGEVSVRAPVLVRDERGRLAQDFNTMADALQAHQEHLADLVSARTLDLENTLAEVRTLRGMIPICGYCKKIRDEEGAWWQMEQYIHDHSEAEFSHGICPECRSHGI